MSKNNQPAGKGGPSSPMDNTIREASVGTVATNHERVCYAAKTLMSEVHGLFPETPVEFSNHDGRNTALDVSFDLTVLDPPDRDILTNLLDLTASDERVEEVISEEDSVLVSFRSSPRTQDRRDPFGLSEAFDILTDEEEQLAAEFDAPREDEPDDYAGTDYPEEEGEQ